MSPCGVMLWLLFLLRLLLLLDEILQTAFAVMTGRTPFSIVTAVVYLTAIWTCLFRLHAGNSAALMPNHSSNGPARMQSGMGYALAIKI